MFTNDCLGELAFEGTSSAIMMAGILISFLVEYSGNRLVSWHARKRAAGSTEAAPLAGAIREGSTVNIMVLEAGIIFHSLSKKTTFPTLSIR